MRCAFCKTETETYERCPSCGSIAKEPSRDMMDGDPEPESLEDKYPRLVWLGVALVALAGYVVIALTLELLR